MGKPINTSWGLGRPLLAVLLTVVFAPAPFAAQEQKPKKKSSPSETKAKEPPTPIPAEALSLGTKMTEVAPEDFLKWARSYAKKEIVGRNPPAEDEAVRKAFDERSPQATPAARGAGVFLLWFVAYQQAGDAQDTMASRIRELKRDISIFEDDLREIENRPVPLSAANDRMVAESRVRQRLEDAERQKSFFERNLAPLQERVDFCLRHLAAQYETVKDSDPAVVRGLK